MAKSYQAMAIVGLFLAILAGSFAGTVKLITYDTECIDGIDNDGDLASITGGIDVDDDACFFYPYSDGNGELETPNQDRYNSLRDYPSLFEYHRDYGIVANVCDAYGLGLYDSTPEDKAEADIWLNAQGFPRINCPP